MAFLDSLDLDFSGRKSHRVRSWYLFEQYQSLEQSQLYAAKRLRNRINQDKMLNLELSERRARRTPYKSPGSYENIRQSKNVSIIDTRTPLSLSTDNFYETFSEIHEPINLNAINSEFDDTDEKVINDWATIDSTHNEESIFDNNILVEEKEIKDENNDVNVKIDISDDINKVLEEVLNNNQESHEQINLNDEYYLSETTSLSSLKQVLDKNENIIFVVWSKFVSFAYQVIQLNHVGFCSSDCSSQLFTAVLACDFIFRGTGRICNILQPYTSPVKYANSDSGEPDILEVAENLENISKIVKNKGDVFLNKINKNDAKDLGGKTKNMWKSKCICSNIMATLNRSSEGDSVANSAIFNEFDGENSLHEYKELCSDCMYMSVRNPILQLIKEMDSQLILSQQSGKEI